MQEKLEPGPITLAKGALIGGRYEILAPVAKGGMGVVYKANQVVLDRTVAIKVLQLAEEDETHCERFKTEAKAAASLTHPNIVAVYDYGDLDDGRPFLVMEFIEGKTLGRLLRKEGPLTERRAINLFIQVCLGLSCAHQQNIIHRDLKPGNIILVQSAGSEIAKLIDFGLAKRIFEDQHLTRSGMILGTPFYMSPEQCRGVPTDARSDIYSLGCVLHETLAGSPPLEGDSPISTMFKHLQEMPDMEHPSIAGASYEIKTVIWRCLQKDPDHRFQTADELRVALEAALTATSSATAVAELRAVAGLVSAGQFETSSATSADSVPHFVQQSSPESGQHEFPQISWSSPSLAPARPVQPSNPSMGAPSQTPHVAFSEEFGFRNQSPAPFQEQLDSPAGINSIEHTAAPSSPSMNGSQHTTSPSSAGMSSIQQISAPSWTGTSGIQEMSSASLATDSLSVPFTAGQDTSQASWRPARKQASRIPTVVVAGTVGFIIAVALCAVGTFNISPTFRGQVLPILQAVSPQFAFQVASDLGDYHFMHDNMKSLAMYQQAESLADKMASVQTAEVAHVRTRLGRLYLLQDPANIQKSLTSSIKAKDIMVAFGETQTADFGMCVADIAFAELKMGKQDQALSDFQQAIKMLEKEPQGMDTKALLDDCYREQKELLKIAAAKSAQRAAEQQTNGITQQAAGGHTQSSPAHVRAVAASTEVTNPPARQRIKHARGRLLQRLLHRF